MFRFDHADLDFGIYRIMNQKRDELERFLEEDLLPQVKEAFSSYEGSDRERLLKEVLELENTLRDAGVPYGSSAKYQELKSKLDSSVDTAALENEVFSDLTNFFRRYYDQGDFISQRRYKEGVYAIPYEGEEVKLHWVNADQYYIKTTEYFRDYTFKLPSGRSAHFRLVEAGTEHDNNKAQGDSDRRFILSQQEPVVEENGELIIRFEYRPVEGKPKQQTLNDKAVKKIYALVKSMDWLHELGTLSPTEANPERTLLEKHLTDYTERNTFDYFIHKDLGGFLRRELDFFIKNEIMHLDDLDTENEVQAERYLSKIKVIKRIGHKIIAFLEQLENFQKKLWLKKKFVVETDYCVTLDRVPEQLYPEIIKNQEQIEEWKRLFAIEEIESTLVNPGYTEPLTIEFLKANPYLMLDTAFFSEEFKDVLLASFDDLDDATDGLLIHSENFQALNLLQERYREKVKCVYIDPPYNTEKDREVGKFLYKDNFAHSTWATFLSQLINTTHCFISQDGAFFSSCDENEFLNFGKILREFFGEKNHVETIVWNKRVPKNDKGIGNIHEYIYLFSKDQGLRIRQKMSYVMLKDDLEDIYALVNKCKNEGKTISETQSILKEFYKKQGYDRGITLYCELDPNYQLWGKINMSWPNAKTKGPEYEIINPITNKPVPIPKKGWRWTEETFRAAEREGETYNLPDGSMMKGKIWYSPSENIQPSSITYLKDVETFLLRSIISLKSDGSLSLEDLGLGNIIDYPKPVELIERLVFSVNMKQGYVLDFFAGSGTTAHAVINLNREDDGNRKYILVEMGEYFDTVLRPRIQKAVYSHDWKDGKPVSREGISHMFKYIRLESYEDTLNNLELKRTDEQQTLLNQYSDMREEYVLSYMLDFETRGSASLLNLDAFSNPFDYKLKVTDGLETKMVSVDLVETFNYLLGLAVRQVDKIQGFKIVQGILQTGEKVLIIWRNTKEQNNEDLERLFRKLKLSTLDFEFDRIYVNGDNNLENIKVDDELWKVVLIEDEFHKLMFNVRDV
jgi:adenine-specific DNA-methyltransferase